MKKSLITLAWVFLATAITFAQDDPVKKAKVAGRALATYNMDRVNNTAKLAEAKKLIDEALQSPDAQAVAQAWITKGEVYKTYLEVDMGKRLIPGNEKAPLSGDNDALVAYDSYRKGFDISQKKYEKSDAIKAISELEGHLINIGAEKFSASAFEKAYLSFDAALKSHDLLKANEGKSIFDDPKQNISYDEISFFAAKAAYGANRLNDALAYYNKLYQKGTAKADAYEGLYRTKLDLKDEAGANVILQEGRKKYPEDTGLLFDEINYYLKAGKLTELTDRLKQAIKKEPTNTGLYVTLGNVYDNLYQASMKDKKEDKAKEYFDQAKDYYNQALAIDPKSSDAIYSIGALYYNKAAFRTQEMNAMAEDYSSAGLKKLEVAKKEIMDLFDQALPYFQKAESVNPNDQNTLIALSEIFARKDDDRSLEFKKRLEKVKAGGKNESSFFKE
jgi:tetratricopeptide (TPR) repeat protein